MDIFSDLSIILSTLDNKFLNIVLLSLYVSVFATIVSSIISIYTASMLVINNFCGKNYVLLIVNSLMSLPPVVVGLILYIIFSFSGILGFLEILYTPTIMIVAQFIIVTPIIISLSYKSLQNRYSELSEYLKSINASSHKTAHTIVQECRYDLLIIIMTGLGRALSEVGAVIIVGGNIANMTRVMTTSIVLETSRGDLALALSLGVMLIILAIIINMMIFIIKRKYL